jgi:hypothetical protein
MSTISAGTTSATTLVATGDTAGTLVFKTNDTGSGGTTALTLATDQTATFASSISTTAISGTVVATQANQETGTSTTTVVSPGRQQYHPSASKFWCIADVSGNITASYNMTSVTDTGTGSITFNINVDFSSANWSPLYSPLYNSFTGSYRINSIAAGTMDVIVFNLSGSATDPVNHSACGFGDQ